MKKTFMLLAIACALLMSVPAMASVIEYALNEPASYDTAGTLQRSEVAAATRALVG